MFDDDVRDTEPPAPDPLDAFDSFAARVRERLEAGRDAYGDRSFERPSSELLGELQQEALDLAGWGFVLWARLRRFEEHARAAEKPARRMCGKARGG